MDLLLPVEMNLQQIDNLQSSALRNKLGYEQLYLAVKHTVSLLYAKNSINKYKSMYFIKLKRIEFFWELFVLGAAVGS